MIAPNTPSPVVPSGASLLRELALAANRGVQLTRCSERGLLARPLAGDGNPDSSAQALLLPLVPARLLERGAGFLRHVWRARGTSAVLWLYAHPRHATWQTFCPPQLCAERRVEVDATFKDCETPAPDLLLAGSLRSVPSDADDASAVAPLLPAYQGAHFVLDLARPLTCLSAYLRTDAGVQPAPAAALIDDPLDPALRHLSDRLMFLTRA